MDKKEVLRKRKNFEEIFKNGRRVESTFFSLYYKKNELSNSRFGVVIKANVGNACKRNRLKRIIRELYRNSKFRFKAGFDFIVVIFADFSNINFQQIKDLFLEMFKKSGLFIVDC